MVISSPTTYRDVQQELIAEIHGTSIWPVVVAVDGNISIPEKTSFIDRDGGYIILIPDANFTNFRTEMNRLAISQFGYRRLWNSEARFVVAGANEFSMAQQTDIFELLSKFRIYNCIVVSLGHDVIHKLYEVPIKINDVEKVKAFVVYTWFPYQSSDRCTDVTDITLLDRWVISEKGHFTKNTDLFPRKISNSFNGCPMNILVRDGKWAFSTIFVPRKDSKGNIGYALQGVETNLLMVLPQHLNMCLNVVYKVKGSEILNKLLGGMISKEIYLGLGSFGTDYLDVSYLDNKNIYTMMSISWYVPCSVKNPRWSSIIRILSVDRL